ncbi:hypothetical protein [Actinomadura napierensis]|uniref:Mce-associated membrane protein n=1 Tax=Actinomadura napierensis TaxID=267854 RepID=A0ABP5KPY2_9ACTN
MTMLGRGKRSAPQKDKDRPEDGKTRKAAAQATKAEEAAEAARLAEEAAARAREAARLAQIAADAAAADAEDTEDAEEDASPKAVKTAVKPRRTKKAPETAPEADDPAADESATDEVPATETEAGDAEDALKTEAEEDTDEAEDEDEPDDAEDALTTEADEAEDEDEDEDDEPEDEAKPRKPKKALTLKKAVKTGASDHEPRRRVGTGRFTLLAVMTVLFLALGTAATLLVLKNHEQNAIDDARRDGLGAAAKAAQELSSYDYRTIDTDTKAAAAMTTGKLHDDYVKQLPSFKAQATAQQLVGTTTVMKTGAVSATSDKVVVLVYADRSSVTKNDKTQQLPESLRLKMTMVKAHGKWLAQKVDVIS